MSVLEFRLREAAHRADHKSKGFTIQVLPAGIRIRLIREYSPEWGVIPRHYVFENFTGWGSITGARSNPLLTCIRDLSKQADEFKP